MAKVTELDVQLIAATEFHAPQGVEWEAVSYTHLTLPTILLV